MHIPVISLAIFSQLLVETWTQCLELDDTGMWHFDNTSSTCYFFSDITSSFNDAIDACKGRDPEANLASLADENAWNFTNSKLGVEVTQKFWIGLATDNPSTSDDMATRRSGWQWLDGSDYSATWSKWYDGQTLSDGSSASAEPGVAENCVMFREGYWFGQNPCDHTFQYICSVPFVPPTTANQSEPSVTTAPPGTNIGGIVGAVVAVVVVAAIVVGVVIFIIKRRRPPALEMRQRPVTIVDDEGNPVERGKSLVAYNNTIVQDGVVITPLDLDSDS